MPPEQHPPQPQAFHGQFPPPPPGGAPGYGYPPAPRSGTPSWVWWIVAAGCGGMLLLILFLAAILLPVFAQTREAARTTSCLSHQKQLALGALMYAQDYDQRLPRATEWMDVITPYTKNELLFRCPSFQSPYGYAFDNPISGADTSKIADPRTTLLLFDSSAGTRNATDAGESLPNPPRHMSGSVNNQAFLDGHVYRVRGSAPSTTGY